jgi:hypothetical protein
MRKVEAGEREWLEKGRGQRNVEARETWGLEKDSGQRNVGTGEVKRLEKKMGGVLASAVSYLSTLRSSCQACQGTYR